MITIEKSYPVLPSYWYRALSPDTGLVESNTLSQNTKVSFREMEAIIASTFEKSGTFSPLFEAANNLELLDIGPVALAFHSAPTLNVAIETLANGFSLINPMLRLHLAIQDNGDAELWFLDHEDFSTQEKISAISQVYYFALVIRFIREALNHSKYRFKLGLMQYQVSDKAILELAKLSGCDISNGHPLRRLFLPKALLDSPCRHANASLFQATRPLVENELMAMRNNLISQQVMAEMPNLVLEDLSLPTMANLLNMSERSLSRKLAAEGASFKQLQDRFKKEKALQLLQSGQLSVTSVAFELGYSDLSAFSRAFRRWTGLAPTSMIPT
ncbi:AraC family transcriptional regulator [Enterovibrio sp. ZSDZ35]|uniref:AraC family transcriptional regulator n=1 Tax=Enterovibrio qingdaonensis TaxID=2899818 RepID=A0ABT5QLF0_9GAMM|nr:helix-turn-helix domain-containing protein [Enterovibrio sp. ZSDZ35]MDD1781805.1 AraC family transcriptional regulator [Enterovibrio sp. ZSDZ35]